MNSQVELNGLTLKNPVMTASGTFGYGLEFMRYGSLEELGAIVVKGLSLEPRQGNPTPRLAETACGMLNAIGLQNIGVKAFVKDKLPYLPWKKTPVIANIYAHSVPEFAALAEFLAEVPGVAALEVNISCPNVSQGGVLFGQSPDLAAQVTSEVKKKAGSKPVIVKLSPNVTDITSIARAVQNAGADNLSLINTLTGMAVDIKTRKSRLANTVGGLSGPAIKPVALRMTWQVCQAVEIPVIGMGGISSAADAAEFILVGAAAVQIGTANFMRPDLSFDIVRKLEILAGELEIKSWSDYRGTLKI